MTNFRVAKTIWHRVPEPLREKFWRWFQVVSIARPDRQAKGISPGQKVVVAGMFRTASGLGAWARSTYFALKSAGYDVTAVDLSEELAQVDFDCPIPLEPLPVARKGTLILHVNGPETGHSLRRIGLRRWRRWRVIAAWAWELEVFPPGWDTAFPYISEIWALSDFTADAFRRHERAPPIRVLPISVIAPDTKGVAKDTTANRAFTVLAMADALSSFVRKNPVGAIRAFRKAFGDREDCRLVIKVRNLELVPNDAQILEQECTGAYNIEVISGSLKAEEQWELIASADVYLSLHRAEGFGLGLAESMSLNVPVIATAWSGNLSFCNDESAVLVPYSLIPVPRGCIHYSIDEAVWADPDIAAAAEALRELEADRDLALKTIPAARASVEEFCGADRVQKLVTQYLEEVPATPR